jgi:asparagine synthase (glutamine-hydrolysing)
MSLTRYTQIVDSPREEFTYRVLSDDLIQSLDNEREPEEMLTVPENFERWHPFTQLQYLEMKSRLPDYITRDLDAASMAYSLELRVPFLDHELVEFCAQIPPALKMRGLQEKYILRQALRNDLPLEILRRRKRGLTSPFEQWIGNLPEFARALLSEDRLREKGYFNPKFVVHMIEQHQSGKANYGKSLMRVLGVHLWDELFVRGCQRMGNEALEMEN